MPLYTKEDIIDDIWQHEGVKVEITHEACSATILYSEVHPRTSDKKTVDDLKDKIDKYLDKYVIMPIDEAPDEDPNKHTLYAGISATGPFKKIGAMTVYNKKEFEECMSKIPDESQHCMIVDYRCCFITSFNRQTH